MDDSNIIDELFARINNLEKENKDLEVELKHLEKEYDAKEVSEMVNCDMMDVEVLDKIKEMNSSEDAFKNVVKKENYMVEHTIEYVPFDNFAQLSIAGDFTNWEKMEMEKTSAGTFVFKTLLLKGYRYAFCFYFNNEVLIDFEREYEENPKTGVTNNILAIPKEGKEVQVFDCDNLYSELTKARKEFYKVTVNDEDEMEIFNKITQFSNFLKEQIDILTFSKEDKVAENQHFYDEKLAKLNDLAKMKFQNVNDVFAERILSIENALFWIKSINVKEGVIKGVRLYDKNGIKVNIDYHINNSILESIPLGNIFNNTYLHSKEESEMMLMDYRDNTSSILKIYYQLLNPHEIEREEGVLLDYYNSGESSEGVVEHGVPFYGMRGRGGLGGTGTYSSYSRRRQQKEIIPYKILPESVDINQYNLEISDNKITEVRNGSNSLSVIFEAILIKEESGNKLMGFISTSSLKVYTTLYNKDIVNIIHIHLNDTSEEIAVESVFLDKKDSVSDYKHFNVDSLGKKLNYKFLFRDYKLVKIFYNLSSEFIDEPQFEEVRLKKENIIKIHSHDAYANYFGKVKDIPIGMLARKDKEDTDIAERLKSSEIHKEGHCQERHLEELPGFVDVEIIFTPEHVMLDSPIKLSLPVCKVIPLSPKEETNFQKAMLKTKFKKVDSLCQRYVEYEKYLRDGKLLSSLSLSDAKEIISDLEGEIKKEEYLAPMDEPETIEVCIVILTILT